MHASCVCSSTRLFESTRSKLLESCIVAMFFLTNALHPSCTFLCLCELFCPCPYESKQGTIYRPSNVQTNVHEAVPMRFLLECCTKIRSCRRPESSVQRRRACQVGPKPFTFHPCHAASRGQLDCLKFQGKAGESPWKTPGSSCLPARIGLGDTSST